MCSPLQQAAQTLPVHLGSMPMNAAASPIGAYTPIVRVGDWLIVSGQVGITPEGQLVGGGTAGELRQAIANLESHLDSQGATLEHVVKTTVFLRHMSDFQLMNQVYMECFGDHRPARSAIGVAELPIGALVEIEAWAWTG